ncbi:hypothetical protein [Virgibacillus halodenitrificans]|uniref:RDD domain-containing protein n=1 Tax=Virgibacillus halodenitrificans TaxID=1482 RepID=A0ABR7VSN4_VIRHA|nr:hypothetical protein [Virgibacillus halodenitrificans]MBD1223582.1 hypothetical protein [Virgibacillus halodenitrificans]
MKIFGHEFTGIELIIATFLISMLYPRIKLHIQLLMIQTNPSRKLLNFIENLLSERKLSSISNIVFLVLYFSLFIVQSKYGIKFIEYQQQHFNLVGVYGFVIGLLSMYGIYIGFLQFIVGDSDKVRYLGSSKIKYLTDTSIWYQITQTKPFLVILFLTIFCPLLIINTSGELQDNLIYAWQTSITMLLWIYIFLIGMSLQIIRILFLIKGKTDSGLESIIKTSISNKYYSLFRKMYRNKFNNEDLQLFFSVLKFDISKVDTQSIGFFLTKVFSKIDMEVGSKYGEFKSVRIEKHSAGESKDYLYDDYKRFISEKWELLSTIQKKINWYYFKKLIDQDMNTFNLLVAETPKVFEEKKDEFEFRYVLNNQIGNVHYYLFDQLIEKAVSDSIKMEGLYEDINNNTREIQFKSAIKNEKSYLLQYYAEVEKYKWKKIFNKYIFTESKFDLPNFSRYNNDELYSQAVFDYLTSNHGDLKETLFENKKLEKLISSMNKKYFVAYSLYQLFYPDSEEWNDNTLYFKRKLIRVFNCAEEEEKKELYISSAKIVAKTHINHRVTFKVLTTIYKDREKQIANMDYYNQFDYSSISPLKILFIQAIISSNNKYSHRIVLTKQQTENDLRIIENLCKEFLRAVDKIPKIAEFEELTNTMEYLLLAISLNMKSLVYDLSIVSLLYYEFIITYKKRVWAGNLFFESIEYRGEGGTSIILRSESIFTFFALKIIDSSYEEYFENKQFLDAFKTSGISILDRKDITLDEYIEKIYERLKSSIYGKIGKASLRQLSIKLEKILFN